MTNPFDSGQEVEDVTLDLINQGYSVEEAQKKAINETKGGFMNKYFDFFTNPDCHFGAFQYGLGFGFGGLGFFAI